MKQIFLACFGLFFFGFPTPGIPSTDSLANLTTTVHSVDSLNDLFKIHLNQNPILAFQYAKQALRLAEETEYSKGMAYSLNNIGVIHQNIGNLDKALDFFQQSLKIHRDIKNADGIASTIGNIGIIYSSKTDYERALNYFNEAHKIIESLNNIERLINSYSNLGNVYFDKGESEKAMEYYQVAKNYYQKLNQKFQVFEPYTNLGNVHFKREQFDSALFYYQKAYDIEVENQSKSGQAGALHSIGITYEHLANHSLAIEYQMNALVLAQEIKANPIVMEIYKALSDVYFAQGQWRPAKDFLLLHIVTKDNIFNQESNRRIYELERTYELEQKESEIELLKKESEIQRLELNNNRVLIVAGIIVAFLLTLLALIYYLKNHANARIKALLQKQNNDIKDGIKYAQSVQAAILDETSIANSFPQSFVFYKPKDIVSGDFYWHKQKNGYEILATVDCTGHGVAGAFMTVIGNSLLNQIVIENNHSSPAEILTRLDSKVKETLLGRNLDISNHSMDMAVCKIDLQARKFTFGGARSNLYTVYKGKLNEIKGDRDTVGDYGEAKTFQEVEVPYQPDTAFYLFSDGFADQFGGKSNKKYMKKRFKDFLHNISQQPMKAQGDALETELSQWMRSADQTDDIMVIGFKLD